MKLKLASTLLGLMLSVVAGAETRQLRSILESGNQNPASAPVSEASHGSTEAPIAEVSEKNFPTGDAKRHPVYGTKTAHEQARANLPKLRARLKAMFENCKVDPNRSWTEPLVEREVSEGTPRKPGEKLTLPLSLFALSEAVNTVSTSCDKNFEIVFALFLSQGRGHGLDDLIQKHEDGCK